MPENFIAFEHPAGNMPWWCEIVEDLTHSIKNKSLIKVLEKRGLDVEINTKSARKFLNDED